MGTKFQLLRLLEHQEQGSLSGQKAAEILGVSRSAVWKAVESLRQDGYQVEALPGGGYQLEKGADVWSGEGIRAHSTFAHGPVYAVDCCGSTNQEAKKLALEGAPHGTLYAAARQEAGRGRMGRCFESPPGGIYLSLLLYPGQVPDCDPALVTAAAAVAVCRAVNQLCGIQLGIKWVNDLIYHGKKCCGILTEGVGSLENGKIEYLVVGVGLNFQINPALFSPEMGDLAISLYPEGTGPVSRVKMAARIRDLLLTEFSSLHRKDFLEEYRSRSVLIGRQVKVLAPTPYEAVVLSIDEEARLVVRDGLGHVMRLSSGEVSVRL